MCEFCSFGPNSKTQDRDQSNPSFSGFFSAEAIEAAVRQAKEQTRRNRRARRQEVKNVQRDNGVVRPNSSDPELLSQSESGESDEGDGSESDDDTT